MLIIDDFHLIKPRTNARMKLFLDKIDPQLGIGTPEILMTKK